VIQPRVHEPPDELPCDGELLAGELDTEFVPPLESALLAIQAQSPFEVFVTQ